MKKAVSLLISLVILLSAFTAIPVHAEGETHKVIIHSAQGLFEDAYADFSSGDIFNVGVNLKSDCQLSQGQFVVKYDPDVFIVSQNFTTDFNFPDPVVNLQNGEFTMVFDSVNQLVNTLSGGNFITFKVKALSTFTSDQTFTFDFQLLEGGRYKTDTDSFGDPRTYIDPSFAKLYIEKSQVKLPGLKVAPHFNEEESVENDEPGTMTATLSNTGYSFGNENWYAYTWTDDGSKWRWVKLGDDNVATGLHENVIFCRVDKNASSPSFDYVWNQTEDLKTKDGGTFTITSWNEGAYGNLSGYWDESDSTFATTVTDAAAASAPSTAAPTTAAPTGTDPAETTAATTAQKQTTDSNINRITVTSTQGLFEDVSENFAANNNFELTIKLKTSYPLSQGTVSMKFDPTQLTVYDRYTSPYTLPDDLVNVTDKGEFVLLFSSITTLVDTTNGGTFFTIRGKTNDAFTGDQKIEVNFDTLIGGRYVTEYDPVFQEYNTYIDKDFDYTYTSFSEVLNHELEVEAVLTNLSGAPATSPTQAPTQTDPTESATPAPTTVAPTTVAPTTAAPTTAAPTTAVPTTVAPTTAAPTGAAGTHKVTVKSPQGIFSDASAYVTPGEMFTIRIELKTEFPLSDATFAATYDPNQVLVGAYSTSLKMPTPTTNRLNGEYRFVLGTGAELVDTTNGGEFVTLKVKAQSAMDSDQIININFETLRSGRYNTVYDEWNEEYVQMVDPTFEQLYIAFNEVKNTDFDMKVYINWTGEQPTTAAPTTVAPTTVAPTTVAPTTVAPTTAAPTTAAPTTVAPTTAAPTTAAPTTAAPTTVAPTTAAPTTVAPTTAAPTSGDGSYKITVKSPQGIFTEASARIMPGEMFTIRIELKTEFPLSDATFAATYDPNQVLVGAYSTSLKMPTPTTNRLNGEYRFVLGTGAELVETTNGGEFVTLKAKALDTMNSDQIINLDFETLRSGRYNTVYDEWNQEYVQIVDPTFEQLYIAFDEVKNTDFDMKVYINWTGEQPTTAAPTTVAPTTVAPTTVAPTTVAPTTLAPTTVAPTTVAPTTVAPTTLAPTTVAPTTLAPTTVAPTTLAPTTVAPTTLAPTTVAPTTAAPTPSPDGKYQLTVRSAQNMFTPFSKRFEPGEEFAIGIKINTSRPIKGCNLTALFDQTQVSVDSYATTKQMTPFTSKYSGKYNFVVGSAGELIDPSGEFIMLRGKCLNEFNTNQEIILDFTYLIVGNLQDPDYEQYFVADGVMLSHDFSVRAYFTEYVEPQPTTAEPTTLAPTTAEPTTLAPTTAEPTTLAPTTAEPTTLAPTTAEPTTLAPTTAEPTTLAPTTAEPTTFKPTETVTEPTETATQTEPISTQPETETTTVTEATEATTAQPTEATTAGPVVPTDATEAPSTAEPTAQPTEATTALPTEATTAGPVVPTDATEAPSTAEPTAQPTEATTALPTEATTAEPTTEIPTTAEPTTQPTEATTAEPSTEATTAEPTTEAPTTQPETTTPATQAPTQAPTKAPATQPTTAKKIDNLDGNPNSDSAVDYVKNLKNDKDPKGSTFGLLRANSKKVTKNSIKITWKKLKGAKKYIIMGNKCGKSYKKITTTTKLSFTQKKLRKGTYYKYMILAVNAKNKVIAVSKTLHVATKGGKIGNYKSVKITNAKSTLTLKKGRKMKLKAKAKKADKKVRNHRKIKFESSKPSVVKITAGGKLTAKKKGTAIIYAYAQNGVFKKIKVKVK